MTRTRNPDDSLCRSGMRARPRQIATPAQLASRGVPLQCTSPYIWAPAMGGVGMSHVDQPEIWRRRAVELRRLAALASDPRARDQLVGLADTWDVLATRAEQRADTGASVPAVS